MKQHPEDIIDCMARMKGDGQPFALATVVRTEDATAAKAGAKAVVRADGTVVGWIGGGCTLGAVRKTAAQVLSDGQARLIRVRPKDRLVDEPAEAGVELHKNACPSGGTVEVFVEPILPHPALIVAGGSPVARALAELGRGAGFAITVAALPEDQAGFTEVDARIDGFDLTQVPVVGTGYVVVATQGKRDREALAAALSCGAPYVAFVGSRKKTATLREALLQSGLPAEQINALRAPAGLDIGAATPEEIALSILAEIVQERRLATRSAQPPAVQIEELEGGSMESRIVSPVLGACHGNDGRH